MVADVKIKENTIEVVNYLKKIERKFPHAIEQSLNRVSAYATKRISEKTQSGKLPDGGRMKPYHPSTVKDRAKRNRETGFVTLFDTGQMFRSLTWNATRTKSSLFFRRQSEDKKAFFHDSGAGHLPRRPFFSIGRKDEIQIQKRFAQHLFRLTGIR